MKIMAGGLVVVLKSGDGFNKYIKGLFYFKVGKERLPVETGVPSTNY